MYQAFDALVVSTAEIDSSGDFRVHFPVDSKEMLFRIQFIKKSDPISTIIIGGQEENHAFFIAKGGDRISFVQNKSEIIVNQENITGGRSNDELSNLLRTAKSDTIPRDSIKQALIRILRESSSEVAALLSVHFMFGLSLSQKEEVRNLLSRLDNNNPYGERIFREYSTDGSSIFYFILLSAVILITTPVSIRYYENILLSKNLQTLSPRELSVVRLLIESKSNKEIAALLNIELSTVKTHVNNSYSKLKINDRKGLVKYHKYLNGKSRTHHFV